MGREDLIGNSKAHLVPTFQPAGTGKTGGEGQRTGRKYGQQRFLTKYSEAGRKPLKSKKLVEKDSEKSAVKGTIKSAIKKKPTRQRRRQRD